jgi:serine/threonine-protein kinase
MDTTLGKYQLVAELAHGGMGTVYLAVARGPARFSKLVVIKQLRPAFAEDPSFTAMFLEEARLAACLHHPNIVQTNEIVCDPTHGYYIVMEYVEGASLKTVVRQLRARGSQAVMPLYARALLDTLAALHYAHDLKDFEGKPLNLVHRDVNPDNVVVAYGGHTKLLDFGIAKAADSAQHTQAGILKGKLRYMAPEQMAGDAVDRRTDIFAVGGMLWDALVGRRLWDGVKGVDVMTSLVQGAIASPRSVNPAVSEELDRICMRALAYKPEDRYPDATSMRADLERAFGDAVLSTAQVGATLSSELGDEHRRMRTLIAEQLWAIDQSPGRPLPSLAAEPAPPPNRGSISAELATRTPNGLAGPSSSELDPFGSARRRRVITVLGVIAAIAFVIATTAAMSVKTQPPVALRTEAPSSAAALAPPPEPPSATHESLAVAPPAPSPVDSTHGRSGLLSARQVRTSKNVLALHPASPATIGRSGLAASAPSPSEPPSVEASAPEPAPAAPAPMALAPATAAPSPAPAAPAPEQALPPGSMPQSAVHAVFQAHGAEIQRCFDRGQMDQLFLSVRISMTATVAPDGHVSSVSTSADRDNTARLQACIRDAVQRWTFPQPAGGVSGHVAQTFAFE